MTIRSSSLWFVACALAACTPAHETGNPAGSNLNGLLRCREQARQQAELQYPRNSAIPVGAEPAVKWYQSGDRERLENQLYEQCARKASAGASTPSS